MLALNFCTVINISIHALLAESDWMPARQRQTLRYFYPRSPCGERLCNMHSLRYCCTNFYPRSPCGERPRSGRPCRAVHKFLSTLSLRRATLCSSSLPCSSRHFYPRSPCGERPTAYYACPIVKLFLSTLSLRRATLWPISCFKSP